MKETEETCPACLCSHASFCAAKLLLFLPLHHIQHKASHIWQALAHFLKKIKFPSSFSSSDRIQHALTSLIPSHLPCFHFFWCDFFFSGCRNTYIHRWHPLDPLCNAYPWHWVVFLIDSECESSPLVSWCRIGFFGWWVYQQIGVCDMKFWRRWVEWSLHSFFRFMGMWGALRRSVAPFPVYPCRNVFGLKHIYRSGTCCLGRYFLFNFGSSFIG